MDLLSILTIASKVVEVAVGIAQDGRQQANAAEVARLRSITQLDLAAIEQDVSEGPAPPAG
jgi:pyruvate/2-oxoglutarate/acetoin dehydrogenase E1 component